VDLASLTSELLVVVCFDGIYIVFPILGGGGAAEHYLDSVVFGTVSEESEVGFFAYVLDAAWVDAGVHFGQESEIPF